MQNTVPSLATADAPPPLVSGVWTGGYAALVVAASLGCGFGLGALILALTWPQTLPAERPADLQMVRPGAAPALTHPQDAAPPQALRDWPALFGAPPIPQPVAAPEPEAAPEAPATPPLIARLRGVAVDGDGGWALIEMDGRDLLVRPGSTLDGYRRVGEIIADGVRILAPDGPEMLTFADITPDDRPSTPGTVRESLARSYLRGELLLFDMPVPLPPAGYVARPGFQGPID